MEIAEWLLIPPAYSLRGIRAYGLQFLVATEVRQVRHNRRLHSTYVVSKVRLRSIMYSVKL